MKKCKKKKIITHTATHIVIVTHLATDIATDIATDNATHVTTHVTTHVATYVTTESDCNTHVALAATQMQLRSNCTVWSKID